MMVTLGPKIELQLHEADGYSPGVRSAEQVNQYQPAELSGMVLTPDPSFFLHMIHNVYARSTMHDPRTHPAEVPRRFRSVAMKHTNTPMTVAELANVRRCQMTFGESGSPWPAKADRRLRSSRRRTCSAGDSHRFHMSGSRPVNACQGLVAP